MSTDKQHARREIKFTSILKLTISHSRTISKACEIADKILGTLNLTVNPHLKVFIIPSYMESSRHWSTLQIWNNMPVQLFFRHNDVQSLLLRTTYYSAHQYRGWMIHHLVFHVTRINAQFKIFISLHRLLFIKHRKPARSLPLRSSCTGSTKAGRL